MSVCLCGCCVRSVCGSVVYCRSRILQMTLNGMFAKAIDQLLNTIRQLEFCLLRDPVPYWKQMGWDKTALGKKKVMWYHWRAACDSTLQGSLQGCAHISTSLYALWSWDPVLFLFPIKPGIFSCKHAKFDFILSLLPVWAPILSPLAHKYASIPTAWRKYENDQDFMDSGLWVLCLSVCNVCIFVSDPNTTRVGGRTPTRHFYVGAF